MSTQIITPTGRIVAGHPMRVNAITDNVTKQPVMQADGVTPATDTYIGLAIPKGPEQHWNQTEWGKQIWEAGFAGYPNGQANAPDFAWKIIDGDSLVPNKKNVLWNTKEGYAGHWVINFTTRFLVGSFNVGNYHPSQELKDPNAIKPGDYGIVVFDAKSNDNNGVPAQTPGVYLNPLYFALERAGELIQTSAGPSAQEAFGGTPQAGQPVPTNTPAAGTPVQPAPDYLTPAAGVTPPQAGGPAPTPTPTPAPVIDTVMVQGVEYQVEALRTAGWNEDQINAAR